MNKNNLKSQSLPSLARLNLHNDSMQMMNAKLAQRITANVIPLTINSKTNTKKTSFYLF